jgi:predicted nucleotidyltransferase
MKFMTPQEQVEFVKNIGFVQEIKKLPFVEKILLFGSRARGNAGTYSDIDIAVVCPQADIFEWNKILDIVDAAQTLLPIDCVRFDKADVDLQEKIKKEGIVV